MKRDFKYLTIVHCSKREQADYLYAEVGAAAGHTREEVLACWDKYKEKTCYGVIRENPWEEPAIAFCGPIDDASFRDREIVPYEEL